MVDPADFAERLELFFGDASDTISQVYARWRGPGAGASLRLVGSLSGPLCQYAHTLPATFTFADCGPGDSLLAKAVVPEPCFWTPEMPHCYRADLTLCAGDEILARVQRDFGIRPLGVRGRDLIFHGRRFVLRGMSSEQVTPHDLSAWHSAEAALCVRHPDRALCAAASRQGVLLLADLDSADVDAIRRLSCFPAVGIVALPAGSRVELAGLAHNLLLAERFAPSQPVVPQPWAQVAIAETTSTQPRIQAAECPVPIIARRTTPATSEVAARRGLCDQLQAELADQGQFAGYLA